MSRQVVTLHAREPERAKDLLPRLAQLIGGGAMIEGLDAGDTVAVAVDCETRAAAVAHVRAAIAALGAEDALDLTEGT